MRPVPRGSGFVARFVRHPNAANLLMILLVLGGVFAMTRLQTQFMPTVDIPNITTRISWPGASAEDVEANIIEAVEPQVRFLDGVKEVTSYAREGSATVRLEFEPKTDMKRALSDVETAIAAVNTLPEDSEEPRIVQATWYETVAKLAVSGPFSESALKVYAQRIRDGLLAAGIDRVTLNGVRDEEIWVEVDAGNLRRLDLTLGAIASRIAETSRDLPAGTISGAAERQLRSLADVKSPEDFAAIDIRALPSGERIRLGDIAKVSTHFDPDQAKGFSGGHRAIEINIQRTAAADTLGSARILNAYLERTRPSLPASLKLVEYDVRSDSLQQRINLLIDNGASGLLVVIVILFVFLNARIAIWVAAGIPVAVMATLMLMWASGQSINMISLFALILTLGIIVDDAIVVGEHTATLHAAGLDATAAAERGVMRMLMPVTAATLTTQVAFLPLFLVRDVIGQIMQALPLVVIAVLTASLVESFFVLPSHLRMSLAAARRKRPRLISLDGVAGGPATASIMLGLCIVLIALLVAGFTRIAADGPGTLFDRTLVRAVDGTFTGYATLIGLVACAVLAFMILIILFEGLGLRGAFDRAFGQFRNGPLRWVAEKSFRWRYVTVAGAVALLAVSLGLFNGGLVKFQFFPSPEAENIGATVVFGAGTPETHTAAALKRIEETLGEVERRLTDGEGGLVVNSFATLGRAGRTSDENVARINVQLSPSEQRSVRTREITAAWIRAIPRIPGVERVTVSGHFGGPPGRDLDIRLSGAEPAMLKEAALAVRDLVGRYPGVSGIADDLPYGKRELVLELTPRGAALGFTVQSVGTQLRNGFEGAIAKRFARGDEVIAVRVLYDEESRGLAGLRDLYLTSPAGEAVPLSEIVRIREKAGFSVIQHRQGKRTVAVTADVDPEATTDIELVEALDSGPLAELARQFGVQYAFSGREEERAKSFADLKLGIGIALGLIYLILAWVFASYSRPLVVMAIIPFGLVGAVFGHWAMGFPLSITSFMALLGLAGILVNDSIILVSRLEERLTDGETLESASVGAAQDRLRAVLLTSLTTIGGLMPLMFETNQQAQFLLPMVVTIVYGLSVATLLVLFLVPAVLGIGEDIRHGLRAVIGPRAARDAAE
jgi:multidrug efflux pump subunit AcrB